MQLAHIPVEKAHECWPLPFRFWIAKILARCQQPGYLHHFGDRLLAALSETNWITLTYIALLLTQIVIQHTRLQCRGCHSLPINRIKTASRVTEDHKALWKARHLLVVTPSIRGELVGDNGRHRLSIFDCLVEVGHRQAACIVEKTCLIVGWVVSQPAYQCHYPAVVFDGNHISPPFLTRRLRVNDQRFPV